MWSIPTEEYQAFESRTSTVKKIMEELRNPNTNMIEVYGIGGVGKTTLVKEVFRQATKEDLFDDVVTVLDGKQNPDLERIQKEIAEKLALDVLENHTVAGRVRILCDRLKDTEILVILDDVWDIIDLQALGLPRVVCKTMLTSRSREILSYEMRTQKEFCHLRSLTFWFLTKLAGFSSKVGRSVVTASMDKQLTNDAEPRESNNLENEIGTPMQLFMNGYVAKLNTLDCGSM